jgi:hypothetical protein
MSYLKQKDAQAQKKRESKQPPQPNTVVLTGPEPSYGGSMRSIQHDINHVAGMDGIEGSLDNLASAVARLTHDDHSVGVAVCQNRYGTPVQLALTDTDGNDMMDRLVAAFERIADSVAKLAGLNRPRLESWHEQDEYTPRYKDTACDGGSPGPKKDAA